MTTRPWQVVRDELLVVLREAVAALERCRTQEQFLTVADVIDAYPAIARQATTAAPDAVAKQLDSMRKTISQMHGALSPHLSMPKK